MLTVKLLESEVLSETFAEVVSKLSCGVLLLDSNQDPVFVNKAAHRMLGSLFPPKSKGPALRGPQRKLVEEAVASAVSCTSLPKPVVPVLLPARKAGAIIALYVMPFGHSVPSALRETFVDIGPSQLSKALRKKTSSGGGHGTR